jgi:DNA-binding NarL/FixJ family response regulator
VRILIANEVSTARVSLRKLLESHSGWRVCGEAVNGLEAIEQTERLAPDVVTWDLRMPLVNGFQAAREISRINPHPPMRLVTVQQLSQSHLEAARTAGFNRAANKGCGREILAALEAVVNNQAFSHLERSVRFA